jgi:ABC-2 type transport system ATP-binding protein
MPRQEATATKAAIPLVVFQDVSKSYGATAALKGVSFDIRRGEVFGFIGPNGAGKTTTMKILVGLLSDFTGSLTVDGLEMPGSRAALYRTAGYMPQSVAFQEWRTVGHTLSTFGRLSGVSRDVLAERIPLLLARLGLDSTRDTKVIHLSGGMTQKLGLAQALLHEPRLLVLDEPVAGLDPAGRIQVKAIVRELRDRGTTVFFSSHILSDVQDVADRVGIIVGGRMRSTGTLAELKAHFSVNDDIEVVLSRDAGNRGELESLPGVLAIESTGAASFLLHLRPDADVDATAHEALARLIAGGSRIRSFHPLEPSLDEIYLKYVAEGGAS